MIVTTAAAADPPSISSVILNSTAPRPGDPVLITVEAPNATSVAADTIPLVILEGNLWYGTITAIEGTHFVNITARGLDETPVWNATQSYTTIIIDYTRWTDQGIIYTAPSGSAYYPSVIRSSDGFGKGKDYSMWYSNGEGSVFRTRSANGKSWSEPETMTGLDHAHHVQVLYSNAGFDNAPLVKYRIWYWDTSAHLYSIAPLATAYSEDGVDWTGATPVTQNPAQPLVTGGNSNYDWHRGTYGPVFLFYHPGASNSGTNPWNYSYTMYFDGTNGGWEQTGLAYSPDGLYWSAVSQEPVLAKSQDINAWDSDDAIYGTVYSDAHGFHFWYSGGSSDCHQGIGYAFSQDGITWKKNQDTVFHINDGPTYRDKRTYTPSVISNGKDSLLMYYSAYGSSTGNVKKIGLATLPLPDNSPPTISSNVPPANAASVSAHTKLIVRFNEPMNPSTITAATICLTGPDGTPVAGTVTYAGVTATFAPASDLAPGSTYTATVSTGAMDLAGNPLAGEWTWTFTTGTPVVVIAPVANFTAKKTEGLVPFTARFIDSSTNTPTSWYWDFGDGNTSVDKKPSYTYVSAGNYTVMLVAANAGGTDTFTRTGYINVTTPVVTTNAFTFTGVQATSVGSDQNVTIDTSSTTVASSGNVLNLTSVGTAWDYLSVQLTDMPETVGATVSGTVSNVQAVARPVTVPIPSLGNPNVSVSLNMNQLPGTTATITNTISSDPDPEAQTSFTLAATTAGKQIAATAYTINFIKTDIQDAVDGGIIANATITMAISPNWVAANGGMESVVIMHREDDGTTTLLTTTYAGTDESGNWLFTAVSPTGLSMFILAALSSVPATADDVPASDSTGVLSVDSDSGGSGGGVVKAAVQQPTAGPAQTQAAATQAPVPPPPTMAAPLEIPETGFVAPQSVPDQTGSSTRPALSPIIIAAGTAGAAILLSTGVVMYLRYRRRRLDPLR